MDNGGISGADTPLRSIGSSAITELTPDTLTDANANFPLPNPSTGKLGLIGLELNPNILQSKTFTIIDNDATTITIEPSDGDMTEVAKVGDTYISEYSFDNVSVSGSAKVTTDASIIVYGDLTVEADSTLQANTLIQPPYIRSLSPASGMPGDTIVLYGLGFSDVLEENIVTFNGVPATVVSASPIELSVIVPDGAADGPVIVTVAGKEINLPPTITSTPVTTGTEGLLYSYDVEVTDLNGDILITTSPSGMTIDAATGLINSISRRYDDKLRHWAHPMDTFRRASRYSRRDGRSLRRQGRHGQPILYHRSRRGYKHTANDYFNSAHDGKGGRVIYVPCTSF